MTTPEWIYVPCLLALKKSIAQLIVTTHKLQESGNNTEGEQEAKTLNITFLVESNYGSAN